MSDAIQLRKRIMKGYVMTYALVFLCLVGFYTATYFADKNLNKRLHSIEERLSKIESE